MRIDRVIDWFSATDGYVFDFVDFFAPIAFVLEADIVYPSKLREIPNRKIYIPKVKLMENGRMSVSVENRYDRFEKMRDDWLKESKTVSKFEDIKPDFITWEILKSPAEEHGRDDSNMHAIIDLVFKLGSRT